MGKGYTYEKGLLMTGSQILAVCAAIALVTGCTPISDQAKQGLAKPVNCATAEGDLRALESEKDHASNQALQGVSAIVPIGLVGGVLTGTEDDKIKVATGEYKKQVEAKIAEIKRVCGL